MSGERVVIADDHEMTRVGLRAALEAADFDVVGEAADADGAVLECRRHRPDVCLLDVRMPGSGISAARRIAGHVPGTKVVMVTVSREDDDLFAALRAGAAGYLLKDTGAESLPRAIRGVLRGEAAMPRTLVARVLTEFGASGRRRVLSAGDTEVELTAREWEVLERLRRGASTRQIAEALSLSEVTVRRHVSAVVAKLGVSDRGELLTLVGTNAGSAAS
jgi:DNA-binding NarL/FixJ family response regulator